VEAEQQAIRRIRKLRSAGLSLRHIGGVLAAEGHPPKRGSRWHPQTLARVLGGLDERHPALPGDMSAAVVAVVNHPADRR
jgi:hypothetical protein